MKYMNTYGNYYTPLLPAEQVFWWWKQKRTPKDPFVCCSRKAFMRTGFPESHTLIRQILIHHLLIGDPRRSVFHIDRSAPFETVFFDQSLHLEIVSVRIDSDISGYVLAVFQNTAE